MKKFNFLLLSLISIILFSCSGSDTYQGKWNCMNGLEEKFEINFSPDQVTVVQDGKTLVDSDYNQYAYSNQNGIVSYTIKGDNIGAWIVHFPYEDNKKQGLILDSEQQIICTISRDNYLKIEQIAH